MGLFIFLFIFGIAIGILLNDAYLKKLPGKWGAFFKTRIGLIASFFVFPIVGWIVLMSLGLLIKGSLMLCLWLQYCTY